MFWVGLGYFEAVGFQKRNLAHYIFSGVWDGFGSLWVFQWTARRLC